MVLAIGLLLNTEWHVLVLYQGTTLYRYLRHAITQHKIVSIFYIIRCLFIYHISFDIFTRRLRNRQWYILVLCMLLVYNVMGPCQCIKL